MRPRVARAPGPRLGMLRGKALDPAGRRPGDAGRFRGHYRRLVAGGADVALGGESGL
jgi:hypothetical protein